MLRSAALTSSSRRLSAAAASAASSYSSSSFRSARFGSLAVRRRGGLLPAGAASVGGCVGLIDAAAVTTMMPGSSASAAAAAARSPFRRVGGARCLSDKAAGGGVDKKGGPRTDSEGGGGGDDPTSQELVLTPGQKVVAGTRLFMWTGVLCFATACAYYIGKELLPSKMSPNTVFDGAFDVIRENEDVKRRFGGPLKAYGRDHGGHREGRRNFVEHTEYTDKDDGSKRTRVRFNLEGQHGQAFVFAEVSSDMPSGEFVYVLVQDKRNGRVFTVIDNRSALMAKRMAGGSKEGMEAFSNLLSGGGGGSKK